MTEKKPHKTSDKESAQAVIKYLCKNWNKGLTAGEWSDMYHGCDLRKRISELIRDGYDLVFSWESNVTKGRHKRWFLREKKAQ
jgi:hypothetical protein